MEPEALPDAEVYVLTWSTNVPREAMEQAGDIFTKAMPGKKLIQIGPGATLQPMPSMADVLEELRRLNEGLEYDRAIAAWKRGEGRHPND
jgi:hypothetical protein